MKFQKGHKFFSSSKNGKGHIVSEETRRKISKANKGKTGYWNKGKKLSEEIRKNMSLAQSGKKMSEESKRKIREYQLKIIKEGKHNKWKGGITPLVLTIRHCFKYRQWISDIFMRDDYTCQKCLLRNKIGLGKTVKLEAHHIKQFSKIIEEYNIKTIEEALSCEELWNINNGITLCRECHNKINKN